MSPIRLRPSDPDYPARLQAIPKPPDPLVTSRLVALEPCAIAIVGAREANEVSLTYAKALAHDLALRGVVIVSGGAEGVDRAAHEGALEANGKTICVAPTGRDHVSPKEHAALFAQIEASDGAMMWPFEDATNPWPPNYLARNAVLVALADILVVVQAGERSGTLNSAGWAKRLSRELLVLDPGSFDDGSFAGNHALLDHGARVCPPLPELRQELRARYGLPALTTDRAPSGEARTSRTGHARRRRGLLPKTLEEVQPVLFPTVELQLSAEGKTLLKNVTKSPQHMDEIAHSAGLTTSAAATLLLTLALENVVVEGPAGFYRRV